MPASTATARAGANIALVKYWGKRSRALNLPAAGSISITLDALETVTTLEPLDRASGDQLELNGQPADPTRVSALLDLMRELAGGGPAFRVSSRNNFPTAAGLASSASAFAALVTAADQALGTWSGCRPRSEQARLRIRFGSTLDLRWFRRDGIAASRGRSRCRGASPARCR
jgi:diphosphomevalonate decarboxylase